MPGSGGTKVIQGAVGGTRHKFKKEPGVPNSDDEEVLEKDGDEAKVKSKACSVTSVNISSSTSSSSNSARGKSNTCSSETQEREPTICLGAELASYDEVKVWTEEGEEESEMTCSERLQAELQDDPGGGPPLIPVDPPDLDPPSSPREQDLTGKSEPSGSPYTPPGFLTIPYPGYPPPPHISRGGSPLSPFLYSEHLGSPPPAHMGSLPYNLDPHKGPVGFRTYPFSSQYGGYPMLPHDITSCAISRFSASGLFSGSGFGSPPLSPPPGMGVGGISLINQVKLEPGLHDKKDKKKPHIKKPLNAFMLYMKEMRPKVVAECTLKESAAINQILGRKWHALTREEQAKYYEAARKERQLHMQMYPGWSARDNYAQSKEKRKRKREKAQEGGGNPLKKCRARWGVDQTDLWCKPCKPEEALDAGGDPVPVPPLYHIPSVSVQAPTSVSMASTTSLHSVQDSLVIQEPLLDLRSYPGVSCHQGGLPPPPPPDLAPDPSQHSPKYICL